MYQNTGHRDLGHNKESVVVQQPQQQPSSANGDEAVAPGEHTAAQIDGDGHAHELGELRDALTDLGIDPGLADSLVDRHEPAQVRDAVDAVAVSDAANPAGWVVAAIRSGWDVSTAAEEQRKIVARQRLREAQLAERQQVARGDEVHASRLDAWADAISAALDDRHLALAISRLTDPLPGLGRRSAPAAQSALVAWAAAVHRRAPDRPLAESLPAALQAGEHGADDRGPLHEAPASSPRRPLADRVAAVLHDLDRPTHDLTEEISR